MWGSLVDGGENHQLVEAGSRRNFLWVGEGVGIKKVKAAKRRWLFLEAAVRHREIRC